MTAPVIECTDLTLAYDREPVLDRVSLAIDPGEIVAILGGSGSGKSTLLRAMVGLLPPSAGTVKLFGHDLYAAAPGERAALLRRTGLLFQHDALFGSLPLSENVALPLRELTRLPEPVIAELARRRLAVVGLTGLERRFPAEVSGGQRKRAALARATVLDPEIVFCDEPTAGLDPINAAQVDHTLTRFREVFALTVVAVTHDLASVRAIADRAIMLGEGKVIATGDADQLEANPDPMVAAFMRRQPLSVVVQE